MDRKTGTEGLGLGHHSDRQKRSTYVSLRGVKRWRGDLSAGRQSRFKSFCGNWTQRGTRPRSEKLQVSEPQGPPFAIVSRERISAGTVISCWDLGKCRVAGKAGASSGAGTSTWPCSFFSGRGRSTSLSSSISVERPRASEEDVDREWAMRERRGGNKVTGLVGTRRG